MNQFSEDRTASLDGSKPTSEPTLDPSEPEAGQRALEDGELVAGRYRVVRFIASGGMGEVYEVDDLELRERVALKTIRPAVSRNKQALWRFRREIRLARKVTHPNVCRIFEFGRHVRGDGGKVVFLTMELLPGETLLQRLRREGPMSESQALPLARQIAAGLAAAHEAGVVHRDLKSSNVLLIPGKLRPRVVISDFGLAHTRELPDGLEPGAEEGLVGTPAYMAPEQLSGGPVSAATDIYALGVVLYELLTGKLPFEGSTAEQIAAKRQGRAPAPPRQHRPRLDPRWEEAILRCLDPDPAARYASALDVAGALDAEMEPDAGIDSVAVLPFVKVRGDEDTDVLSDGITESLIHRLSQLPRLKVMARSTVFAYKDAAADPRKVGRELQVRAVLTGRVLQHGKSVLVRTELIDVQDGSQLWSEQFRRPQAEIFTLEEQIAQEISEKLRLKLTHEEQRRLSRRHTQSTEAYHLYLKGRYSWNKRTREGFGKAIHYLKEAIALDPDYALAHAGLADCYVLLPEYGIAAPKEAYPQARAAALRALELDPTLAGPHATLGLVLQNLDRDFEGGEREFRRSIELNPNYATAHHWYGDCMLALTGRYEEAVAELRRAQELDPLSLIISADLAHVLLWTRQYELAIEECRRTLEMDAGFARAHSMLGRAYLLKGQFAEAAEEFRTAVSASGQEASDLAMLGYALAWLGSKDEARGLAEGLMELSRHQYVQASWIALLHLGLGDWDAAFTWLERAHENLDPFVLELRNNPLWDELHTDPRAAAFLRRIGLSG